MADNTRLEWHWFGYLPEKWLHELFKLLHRFKNGERLYKAAQRAIHILEHRTKRPFLRSGRE